MLKSWPFHLTIAQLLCEEMSLSIMNIGYVSYQIKCFMNLNISIATVSQNIITLDLKKSYFCYEKRQNPNTIPRHESENFKYHFKIPGNAAAWLSFPEVYCVAHCHAQSDIPYL